MDIEYYCPICGADQDRNSIVCTRCGSKTNMEPMQHDIEYYEKLSIEQYGNAGHAGWIMLEERERNPKYNATLVYKIMDEKYGSFTDILKERQNAQRHASNVPKCPTCGSSNIEKISAVRRGTHAVAFGLFSKTARSQFECKDCGYKW